MINSLFALGTWEIHLQTKNEQSFIIDKMKSICKYIDTAIDYNNDYLLDSTKIKDYTLISKISSYHFNDYEFFVSNHLKCLKRDYIDIMLIHSSRGDWQSLANKMKSDKRFHEIGVSNFNIDELNEFKTIVGHYPLYNEVEVNPYYTDIETIDFCKANNIKIIAYGVLGGKYNAIKNVADFSIPYLLSHAAHYADIVILKPECERHVNEFIDVVNNYVDEDIYDYKPLVDSYSVNADNKAIVPMRYDAKDIIRKFNNYHTYNNACGNNATLNLDCKYEDADKFPVFEMLGDYMTYIRYKYRQNYNDDNIYDYDFLIGDDNKYHIVCIYDNNKLTKINLSDNNNNVKIITIDRNEI